MFLKVIANPHAQGRLTRTVMYEAAPGQIYAIDAERLHEDPSLLDHFSNGASLRVRLLDYAAYFILVASVLASFFAVFWLFMPGVAACAVMLSVNRKSAGEIARGAARRSADSFRRLHEMGLLWLVSAT